MKKPIKSLIFFSGPVLVGLISMVVITNSFASMIGRIKNTNQTIKDNYVEPEAPIDYIDDTRDTKSYIFEAETAIFNGVSNVTSNDSLDHNCAILSYDYDTSYSGGIAVKNVFSPASLSKPNNFTFKVSSDGNVSVRLNVFMSGGSASAYTSLGAGDIFKIKVNKTLVSFDEKLPKATSTNNGIVKVPTVINLKEGENDIVIETKPFTNDSAGVLDYIEILTTRELTLNYTPMYWDMSVVDIEVPPTEKRVGRVKLECPHISEDESQTICGKSGVLKIPDLITGVETAFYTVEKEINDAGEEITHYFLNNESKSLVTTTPLPKEVSHKLTIQSDYVTFTNGEKTCNQWEFYDFPEIKSTKKGYKVVGWYNVNNKNEIWAFDEFCMPKKDLVVAPYFEVEEFTYDFAVEGKIDLNTDTETYKPIHSNGTVGFSKDKLKDGVTKGMMIDKTGYAEVCTLYTYSKLTGTGWSFITCNTMKTSNVNMDLIITLENQGKDTLSFDLYQTNASGNPYASTNPHKEVTLKAGETTKLELQPRFSNVNIMTAIKFNCTTSNPLQLAMTQYVKKPSTLPYHDVTIQNIAGSNYKVEFANGKTTASVQEEKALPELKVTAPEGYDLLGFATSNNYENIVSESSFIMGKENVTLIPVFGLKDANSPDLHVSSTMIHTIGLNGFTSSKLSGGMKGTIYVTGSGQEAFYQKGTTMKYEGGVSENWSFMNMTSNTVSGKYDITYSIKNNGTEKLEIFVRQVNNSSEINNASATVYSATVEIAPGECKTFTISNISLGNSNTLTYYKFLSSTSTDLDIITTQYFVKK